MGTTQRTMMKLALNKCKGWSESYPKVQTRDMVLTGKSGLGKTYLLHCMAKVLLERGYHVILLSAYRFLEIARRTYLGRDNGDGEMESLMEADVLMIDDLGTEPFMENITIVQLFNLLNERQLANRATIISTNLNEKDLRERYTERVASRLLDKRTCTVIPFAGEDIRRM